MTIYFHIGSPKTGTTALQQFLAANRKQLADLGYDYPSFLGQKNHTKLGVYAVDADRVVDAAIDLKVVGKEKVLAFRQALEEEYRDTIFGQGNYIFSNEHCIGYLYAKEEIERLKTLITSTGQDVRLIVYFREPVSYHVSRFSTNVKGGRTNPLKKPSKKQIENLYDYYGIVNRWAEVFGHDNITVRLFARENMKDGDVRQDFCQCLDFDTSLFDFNDRVETSANRSMDYMVASFLMEMNALVPRYVDQQVNPIRGDLAHLGQKISTREGILVPEEIVTFMNNQLKDSMAKLNKEFLGGEEVSPFAPYSSDGKLPMRRLKRIEFFEIFADLWRAKMAKEKRLMRKLRSGGDA